MYSYFYCCLLLLSWLDVLVYITIGREVETLGILDESDDELVMEELRKLGLDFAFELLNF